MSKTLYNPIRDPNPCYGCTRPEKRPGCHDTCEDRRKWVAEKDRVNKNRRDYAYQSQLGWRTKK